MPMEHKAYAFGWSRFEAELMPELLRALTDDDPAGLGAFIDRHWAEMKDPCSGEPLSTDWRDGLANRDVHEYGDLALTRYYDPAEDHGVGYGWAGLSRMLPSPAAAALLGVAVGPAARPFDPGRYGSYFQSPGRVMESLAVLQAHARPELVEYLGLLERCAGDHNGVYVTF